MNVRTGAYWMIFGFCLVLGILATTPFVAADTGVRALRIACPEGSDRVEIEPFIAWGDGNSPHPQFGAEQAMNPGILHDGDNWFYSFDVEKKESIYATCQSKSPFLRVFVTDQREITVTERGRVVIDALPVGDTWANWNAIYVLRSKEPNVWDECYGRKSAGHERCVRFDPASPNSKFLSESATRTK